VLAFDYQPVDYRGFIGCITHSLALTDKGLFEEGIFHPSNPFTCVIASFPVFSFLSS